MERGLMWLPLLGIFIWLAWAGWREYNKLQAYEGWVSEFDRGKYDIRAVLAQAGHTLTWGQPTPQGPINLQHLDLNEVANIQVQVGGQPLPPGAMVKRGQPIELVLTLNDGSDRRIPFIDDDMANRWEKALQESLQALKSAST
jgi:hypothetical protein